MRSAIRAAVLARQRQRLVVRVRVDRLRAPRDRGQRLDRDPDDVVLRLLGGERRPARLRVEAERRRARVRRAETLAHDPGPQPPRRSELRDLLEEVVVRVEEEGEALAEGVRRQARGNRGLAVRDAVGERERELLGGARPRLADVVAGDRDRVEARQPLGAVCEEVGRKPHRRPRREDVVPARDVLLQHVVLDRPAKLVPRDAVGLGDELVQEEQECSRRVDRHRGRDVAERDALEQHLPCPRSSRSRPRCARPRPPRAGRPSRSQAASGGRTRPRAPSARARAGSGSARSTPPPSRSPRTGASSTDARGTSWSTARA